MAELLIPAPRSIEYSAGAFTLDALTSISFTGDSLFTAQQLQSAIREATGLTPPILTGDRESGVVLRLTPGAGEAEAYSLEVTSGGITLTSSADRGLFYGVQTLKQLVRIYGARLPAMAVRDEPAMPHRGVMLDVSRGKVPKLSTLCALVDELATYKYNQLQLYVEHTFAFASHPDISEGVDPLTPEDILVLDGYCKQRHVELIPNLQSFGHQRHLLSLPQYSHLDEVGWRWSLTPAREETYSLLSDLYADFLPVFSSSWLNVDCDETWDLGTGQSKALANQVGKGRVYLQHILRLHEIASQDGRRIMMWADVLHHYPDLVPELPDDVLLLDWAYEAADAYPTTRALGESRRAFWVCPGTSSWNTLFPRLDNAIGNIRQFTRDGLANGADGMLLTDWGDYGHYSPLSLSWYPYLFGAATAWTGAQTDPADFERAFDAQFLRAGSASVTAMRRLGHAVTLPGLGHPNRSNLALGLFQHIDAPRESLEEVLAAAEEAIGAWASIPDQTLRHDYGFSARLIAFTAEKLLGRMDANECRRRVSALRDEFEARWLHLARRSEIELTLRHFESMEPREILWQEGRGQLRKLAELAGAEALPPNVRAWIGQT